MPHQKDYTPPQSNAPDNPTPAGHNPAGDVSDDVEQALEAGDPQLQGRSRGQVTGQPGGQREGGDPDPESGRHKSVPEM